MTGDELVEGLKKHIQQTNAKYDAPASTTAFGSKHWAAEGHRWDQRWIRSPNFGSATGVTDEYDEVISNIRMLFDKAFQRSAYGIVDISTRSSQLMAEAKQCAEARKPKSEILPLLKDLRHSLIMDRSLSDRKGWL